MCSVKCKDGSHADLHAPTTHRWILWLVVSVVCGCSQAEGVSAAVGRSLLVEVTDDVRTPLRGIRVGVSGQSQVATDSRGQALLPLGVLPRDGEAEALGSAHEQDLIVTCPTGYRSPEPRRIQLAGSSDATRLTMRVECRPMLRTVALVVHAPGAEGAVVLADGEPLGEVAGDATLHALVQRAPHSVVRFSIDTTGRELVPKNPTREVRLADSDELVVFDAAFLPPARPARPQKRKRALTPVPPYLPYAIHHSRS